MRGSHAGSFEVMHARARRAGVDATRRPTPASATTSSSWAAASAAWPPRYYFRAAVGPDASVLVLDNHDDFGGHAKRNEFTHDGRMLMLNGGTLNIEAPKQYSDVAMGLLRRIGIDIDRFETQTAHDRAHLPADGPPQRGVLPEGEVRRGSPRRRHAGRVGARPAPGAEFLAKAPLSGRRRAQTSRASRATDQPDYMAGLSDVEKKRQLLQMSYQDYLLKVAKVHPDAAWYYQARTTGLFLMMTDAVPAYYGWNSGYPGFQGLKLEPTPREVLYLRAGRRRTGARTRRAPTRAAARSTSPTATRRSPGCWCGRCCRTPCPARRRKTSSPPAWTTGSSTSRGHRRASGSTARSCRLPIVGDPASAREVAVTYVADGQTRTRARRARRAGVLELDHPVSLPRDAGGAEGGARLRHQGADRLHQRASSATGRPSPSSAWRTSRRRAASTRRVQLAEPVTIGGYQCSRTPDEPMVLHLVRTPCAPGQPRKEQHRLGRAELLSMPFETFEREIRQELGRMLAGGGFDPARDILGITVNRWPHGYTYNYNTLADPVAWSLATPGRPGVRRRPPAVRPDFDRQRRCRRQLAHRRGHRAGVPRRSRSGGVARRGLRGAIHAAA